MRESETIEGGAVSENEVSRAGAVVPHGLNGKGERALILEQSRHCEEDNEDVIEVLPLVVERERSSGIKLVLDAL